MSPLDDGEEIKKSEYEKKLESLEKKIDGLVILTFSCWLTYMAFRILDR